MHRLRTSRFNLSLVHSTTNVERRGFHFQLGRIATTVLSVLFCRRLYLNILFLTHNPKFLLFGFGWSVYVGGLNEEGGKMYFFLLVFDLNYFTLIVLLKKYKIIILTF